MATFNMGGQHVRNQNIVGHDMYIGARSDHSDVVEHLQEESVWLAQHLPPQHKERGFFHLLVGVATLVAIAFDLGATAAVITSLFGLSTHRSVV